jgi:hypothetical protein
MVVNYSRVRVTGAPGYEDFEADLILQCDAPVGQVSIVADDDDEIHVIDNRYVQVI